MLHWLQAPTEYLPWQQSQRANLLRRVAAGQLGHAVLLAGPSGTGKRALANAMVASLLCLDRAADGRACGVCASCKQRLGGTHLDLVTATPEEDKRELGIDRIREFTRKMYLTGELLGRVGVIDPADALNTNSANAVLKTLEEPPAGTHIILIADRPSQLLPTILSRCQIEQVGVADTAAARRWLQEQVPGLPDSALEWFQSRPLAALPPADDSPVHLERGLEHAEHWQDWERDLAALWAGRLDPVAVAARVGKGRADAWTRWLYRMLIQAMRGDADWTANAQVHQESFRALIDSNRSALRQNASQTSRELLLETQMIACAKAGILARRR